MRFAPRLAWTLAMPLAGVLAPLAPALATEPKIDAETCTQLRLEQIKFRQSGILNDIQKGPEWAKANLSTERLREVEHYLSLDEQVKFGCRDAKLSPDAQKASEAATRIELNSDADPTAPPAPPVIQQGAARPVADPPKPAKASADKPTERKKTTHKKPKPKRQDTDTVGNLAAPTSNTAAQGPAPVGPAPASAPASELGFTSSPGAPQP